MLPDKKNNSQQAAPSESEPEAAAQAPAPEGANKAVTASEMEAALARVARLAAESSASERSGAVTQGLVSSVKDMAKKADSDGDGVPDIKGIKALFYDKDGQVTKTGTFAVLGNACVLLNYMTLTLLAGAHVTLPWFSFTVPAFDSEAAMTILGFLNGTYLGNNYVKTRTQVAAATASGRVGGE